MRYLTILISFAAIISYLGGPDWFISLWYPQVSEGELKSGIVIVTGTSTGIGADAAKALEKVGFTVLAGIRKVEDGKQFSQYKNIIPIILDVTKSIDINNAVKTAIKVGKEKGLKLVGLVNNAGILQYAIPIEWVDMKSFRDLYDVNVFGALEMTQAALPELRKNRGRVIAISSIAGKFTYAGASAYCSSKHALESIFTGLRRELIGKISVSLIVAGCVHTPIFEKTRSIKGPVLKNLTDGENTYEYLMDNFVKNDALMLCDRYGDDPKDSTSPVIVHAMTSEHPLTSYTIGSFLGDPARLIVAAHWFLPARIFDMFLQYVVPIINRLKFSDFLKERDRDFPLEVAAVLKG